MSELPRGDGPMPPRVSARVQRFPVLPLGAKLALLVAVFVLFVGCLLAFTWLQAEILSGVRAYVAGEGLWSKGQKDAVYHLLRYVETRDEDDFALYRAAIAVPLGDRQAREMLERPTPDLDVVRDGFLRGRNHPEDISSMIWLFRRFRRVGYMAKAIAIWTAGDRYVADLRDVGERIHVAVASGHPDPRTLRDLRTWLDGIDRGVAPIEAAFSRTLGKGARQTKVLMRRVTVATAIVLVGAGLWLAWMLWRHTREWETRYRYLLATAGDGIIVSDPDGIVLEANDRMGELLGVPPPRLVGMREAELYREPELAPPTRPAPVGRPRSRELELRRDDGRVVPVEVTSVVTELGGSPVVQSIVRDVTERKRAENERAQLLAREQAARTEAERASRVKDEFLSVLSHELRTPLTPIFAWARLLQRDEATREQTRRGVAVIERSGRALARLIAELLDVSRIISGKLRLDVRPVEVADVVESALESVRVAAEAKGIRLETVVAPGTGAGRVLGDPDRLQQVVWNLVSNAIKFTPSGGRVTITIAGSPEAVTLTVRDTGAGIPAPFLPHVFERFRQADSSSVRQHGGLGLGLAIVRHLVELHGGTVAVASTGPGQGAAFTVCLPAQARPAVADEPEPEAGIVSPGARTPSLAGLRVLVVEDEPDTCDLVATVLAANGAEVRSATSAAAALATLESWEPDVLVSDVGMPGQDGHALVRAFRARGPSRMAPAIALTAYARAEDRRAALKAGFTHHLAKPFDPSELVTTVAGAAGRA